MYPRTSPAPAHDPVTLVWSHNPAAVVGVVICALLLIAWWHTHLPPEDDDRDGE